MKVSIIIRTKNEERWISSCLESVFNQNYDDFEVILVDNCSDDATVAKAQRYSVKLVTIDDFLPGLAINEGIRVSTGDVLVCLSGHCIPVNADWLKNLVWPLSNTKNAGVYGRQQPMSFTTDRDKRDLLTTFGLDPKIQKKDTFFHNANSAFRRETWNKFPFDEKTPHIEDRLWAHEVLKANLEIYYEPEASVFHYHGIHQDDNPQRRRNVVQILEGLTYEGIDVVSNRSAHALAPDPKDVHTIALIPVRGESISIAGEPLLTYAIENAKNAKFIDRVFVLTDSKKTAELAKQNGAEVPFLRPKELSRKFVSISEVLKFGLEELRQWEIFPDLCVVLEETYPFRPEGLVDDLIIRLLREGTDCAIAVKPEERSIWVERENRVKTINPMMPRSLKTESFYVSLFGLGFVTYAAHIYDGSLGMSKPCLYTVDDHLASEQVNDVQKESRVISLLHILRSLS